MGQSQIPVKRMKITSRQKAKKLAKEARPTVAVFKDPNLNFLTTNEALKVVKEIGGMNITLKTLLTWIVKYKMGRKIGGRWVIYQPVFLKFLNEGSKGV